jgi:hypothetical protein
MSVYECHGWTDKFQLFQFSFSSVAYSQKSVRPYGGPEPKKRDGQTQTETHPIGGTHSMAKFIESFVLELNVTDGTIQEQTCRTINITFSQYAMQCNAMQYNARNAMQCNTMHVMHNAMQCNAMQCMYGSPSVRTE